MKILSIKEQGEAAEFETFLNNVSEDLAAAICKKLHAYAEAEEIYMSNRLKILKPKCWGYKGTIFKLRVDCGKESARIMFTKTPHNDIVLLHGFIKKTQKTPKKDANIAIKYLELIKNNTAGAELTQLPLEKYFLQACS